MADEEVFHAVSHGLCMELRVCVRYFVYSKADIARQKQDRYHGRRTLHASDPKAEKFVSKEVNFVPLTNERGVYLVTKKDSAERENILLHPKPSKIYACRNFFPPKINTRGSLNTPVFSSSSLTIDPLANNSVAQCFPHSNITSTSSMTF